MAFELGKLLIEVFSPASGERVLVATDMPTDAIKDNPEWKRRRIMARKWHTAFTVLGKKAGFTVHPMLSYDATGANGAPLPEHAIMDKKAVSIEAILKDTDIVASFTEFSATAPFSLFAKKYGFRGASMPGIERRMEKTALMVDYEKLKEKCKILMSRLSKAEYAEILFSTGHELYVDMRGRKPHADDGIAKKGDMINLPSGEVYIAPYEGEDESIGKSKTFGLIPAITRGFSPMSTPGKKRVVYKVAENRIVSVLGKSGRAKEMKAFFDEDAMRGNIAELGFGCNDMAVVTGNVLEDEKAGFHWAYGMSSHLGGKIGPDAFKDKSTVVHNDIVYAVGNKILIKSLVLEYSDGKKEEIMKDSVYTIF